MIARASTVLLSAYLLIAGGGVVFLVYDSEALSSVAVYDVTSAIWTWFYILGGLIGATFLILQDRFPRIAAFTYFEVSGMSLLVAANAVYSYALWAIGERFEEPAVYGTSIVVFCFALSLTARAIETIRRVRLLTSLSDNTKAGGLDNG